MNRRTFSIFAVCLFLFGSLLASGCVSHRQPLSYAHPESPASPASKTHVEEGLASWYGPGFHGRKTASGVRFNQSELTCAHKTLPFGSKIKVTNLNNDESVIVIVNDRGPFVRGRIVDLSRGAAQRIGLMRTGTAPVRVETVRTDEL